MKVNVRVGGREGKDKGESREGGRVERVGRREREGWVREGERRKREGGKVGRQSLYVIGVVQGRQCD